MLYSPGKMFSQTNAFPALLFSKNAADLAKNSAFKGRKRVRGKKEPRTANPNKPEPRKKMRAQLFFSSMNSIHLFLLMLLKKVRVIVFISKKLKTSFRINKKTRD